MKQSADRYNLTPQPEEERVLVDRTPQILLGLRGLVTSYRSHPYHVAILTRSRGAGIKQVVSGFTEHISLHAPSQFTFTWFDGANDEATTLHHAMNIVKHYAMPFDAVVTVGAMATQVTSRAALLLNTQIPIIFTSISHPSHIGLMHPGMQRRQNITGIAINDTEYVSPVSVLQSLKKTVQSVLLPFDPTVPGTHQRISEMARHFLSRQIQVHTLPVQKPELVTQQIASFIHNIDTVITLRNEIVVNNMPSIVTMCNDFGVTIFSSDLASVEQGAALGYSPKEHVQGIEAAQYLLKIFKENVHPQELPVKDMPVVHFVGINEATLDRQGVEISSQELDNIQAKVLYKKEAP